MVTNIIFQIPMIITGARSNISPDVTQIFFLSLNPNMQKMRAQKPKANVEAIRQKRKSRSTDTSGNQVSTTTKPTKLALLSNLEVSEFLTRNKISDEDELFPIAHAQKE